MTLGRHPTFRSELPRPRVRVMYHAIVNLRFVDKNFVHFSQLTSIETTLHRAIPLPLMMARPPPHNFGHLQNTPDGKERSRTTGTQFSFHMPTDRLASSSPLSPRQVTAHLQCHLMAPRIPSGIVASQVFDFVDNATERQRRNGPDHWTRRRMTLTPFLCSIGGTTRNRTRWKGSFNFPSQLDSFSHQTTS